MERVLQALKQKLSAQLRVTMSLTKAEIGRKTF